MGVREGGGREGGREGGGREGGTPPLLSTYPLPPHYVLQHLQLPFQYSGPSVIHAGF